MTDDELKQMCWEIYWEGYKQGRDVESYPAQTKRAAQSLFEQFWSINVE